LKSDGKVFLAARSPAAPREIWGDMGRYGEIGLLGSEVARRAYREIQADIGKVRRRRRHRKSPLYLRNISAISPQYLRYISAVSPLHLRCISAVSPL